MKVSGMELIPLQKEVRELAVLFLLYEDSKEVCKKGLPRTNYTDSLLSDIYLSE